MSQATYLGANKKGAITVDPKIFEKWRGEVSKLHKKKQKNWKSYTIDKRGERSKVTYDPKTDTFYDHGNKFVLPIIPNNPEEWKNAKACSAFGKAVQDTLKEFWDVVNDEYCDCSDFSGEAKAKVETALINKLTEWTIERNQTGNHTLHAQRETHGYGIIKAK